MTLAPVWFCWALNARQAKATGAPRLGLDESEVWAKATGLTDSRMLRGTRYAIRPLEARSSRLTLQE